MSRGYSVAQWVKWVEAQETSGLSVAAFCEAIGVSPNAFYARRRQLAASPDVGRQESSGDEVAGFVSLKLAAREAVVADGAVMEIELPGGVVVRVKDPQVVRDVVSVILEDGAPR